MTLSITNLTASQSININNRHKRCKKRTSPSINYGWQNLLSKPYSAFFNHLHADRVL
jgi:hypothetical protein